MRFLTPLAGGTKEMWDTTGTKVAAQIPPVGTLEALWSPLELNVIDMWWAGIQISFGQ